jgi:hypothetical protein
LGTIQTQITIEEWGSGAAVVSAHGTLFPNAEVWMYGGPGGPTLLLDFNSPYSGPIRGLSVTGDLLTGQRDDLPMLYPFQ